MSIEKQMNWSFLRYIGLGVALFTVMSADRSSAVPEAPQPYFDFYEQELVIQFKSTSAAEKAILTMLPLHEGKELAVTCRWDDNWYDDNPPVAKMTEEIGIKGTFFLNDINGDSNIPRYKKMGEACLAAGHSLGTHGMVHAPVSVNNPNYLAEEFLRDRILIESTFNTTVNSHAWAFMDTGGTYFMDEGNAMIAEVLFRSGLNCNAQDYGVTVGGKALCPRIGITYNNHAEKLTAESFAKRIEKCPADHPSVYIMPIHTQWYKDRESEIDQAKTVAGNPNYWYCTINEYGAYRNQFLRTEITTTVDEKTLMVQLKRPVLRDLNDAIPLTFQLAGCKASDVAGIKASDATVTPLSGGANGPRFLLGHATSQMIPTQIGAVNNDENKSAVLIDENFAALQGGLVVDGNQLSWALKNTSGAPLDNIRLTFRLPYAYSNGVQTIELTALAPGKTVKGKLSLEKWTEDYKYNCGIPFYVVQVDAISKQKKPEAVRFYLSTRGAETPFSPSYPKGNFATLGPIPDAEWSEALLQGLLTNPKKPLVLDDGTKRVFSAEEINPSLMEELPSYKTIVYGYARYWEAEMVLTTGTMSWLGKPLYGYWILQSQIKSPENQEVYLLGDNSVQQVFLNGEEISMEESKEGWNWQPAKRRRYRCPMKAGVNDFVVVANVSDKNAYQSKQGTMIYFTRDKQTQSPVKNLTFSAPKR